MICSAAENDLIVDDKYAQKAGSKMFEIGDSTRDGDQAVQIWEISSSKNSRIAQEDEHQSCFARIILRTRQNILAAFDEQSVAQIILAMNSENEKSQPVFFRQVSRAGPSLPVVLTKQTKDIKSYVERYFMMETV